MRDVLYTQRTTYIYYYILQKLQESYPDSGNQTRYIYISVLYVKLSIQIGTPRDTHTYRERERARERWNGGNVIWM